MKFGYYFADSRYGPLLDDVHDYTSFTFCEGKTKGDWWYHGSRAELRDALRRAADLSMKVHLNFQDTPVKQMCRVAGPWWDHVELIDLMDEPPYKMRDVNEKVAALKAAVKEAGLKRRPVGAVFSQGQVNTLNGWKASELQWVGIEGYVDPQYQHSKTTAVAALRTVLRGQLDLMPEKPIVVVGQAYDRNGAWKNLATLEALQEETYEIAAADERVTHLRWFSYGRPGGTRGHRSLVPYHRQIVRKDQAK